MEETMVEQRLDLDAELDQYRQTNQTVDEQLQKEMQILLGKNLTNFGRFSARTINVLQKEGIATVFDLATKSENNLLDLENFGTKSLDEVREFLEEINIPFNFNPTEYGIEIVKYKIRLPEAISGILDLRISVLTIDKEVANFFNSNNIITIGGLYKATKDTNMIYSRVTLDLMNKVIDFIQLFKAFRGADLVIHNGIWYLVVDFEDMIPIED